MKWRDAAETLSNSRASKYRAIQYLSEVLVELDNTTWPTKEEVWNSTVVVLITVAFFAAYLGIVDLLLTKAQEGFYGTLSQWMLG